MAKAKRREAQPEKSVVFGAGEHLTIGGEEGSELRG